MSQSSLQSADRSTRTQSTERGIRHIQSNCTQKPPPNAVCDAIGLHRQNSWWYSPLPSSVAVFDYDTWQRTNQRPDHRLIMFLWSTERSVHVATVRLSVFCVCASLCPDDRFLVFVIENDISRDECTRGRDKHWLGRQAHVDGDRWQSTPYKDSGAHINDTSI